MKRVKGIRCLYCGKDIDFTVNGQWVHENGNAYSYACPDCGWLSVTPPAKNICPDCDSILVSTHPAYPDLTDKEWEEL